MIDPADDAEPTLDVDTGTLPGARDAPPDPEEAPEPPADPQADTEPVAAPEEPEPTKAVTLATAKGSLTLDPHQKTLNANQHASLAAIGIDPAEPGIIPHVRAFIHTCQIRGLDPWAKEAYLIARGDVARQNRTYTMQTGIDGYRKMGNATGRFIRVKERLWTGADDDEKSYMPVTAADGSVVMRRVWFDQWPASRGYPGAAKVVIEHYDPQGNVVETAAVADWGMYAPLTRAWHWGERRGEKVFETNEDGSEKWTLSEMWEKGYAHMIAKVAEALAFRLGFPATMSGIYTHEEMHRADQEERNRLAASTSNARQQAYAAATGTTAAEHVPDAPEDAQAADEPAPAGPMPLTDVMNDVMANATPSTAPSDQDEPEAPEPTDDDRYGWLLAELGYHAEVLGTSVADLTARARRAAGKPLDEFTGPELARVTLPLRSVTTPRLQAAGETEAAAILDGLGNTIADVVGAIDALPVHGEVVE